MNLPTIFLHGPMLMHMPKNTFGDLRVTFCKNSLNLHKLWTLKNSDRAGCNIYGVLLPADHDGAVRIFLGHTPVRVQGSEN
jgi:hypothetical protein